MQITDTIMVGQERMALSIAELRGLVAVTYGPTGEPVSFTILTAGAPRQAAPKATLTERSLVSVHGRTRPLGELEKAGEIAVTRDAAGAIVDFRVLTGSEAK